jgi:hypothetical protein
VILPDTQELEQSASPRELKRRQSTSSDPSAKRPRLSTEAEGNTDSPGTVRASPHGSPVAPEPIEQKERGQARDIQKNDAQEERKRGKRLFGGLINTLSQSASDTQQKRRQDIEKRQQEKARLQKAEDETRRAEKLRKLKEVRTKEQVKFDEESV